MADRIYLMQAGKLIQSGPPAEVYARPNSEFAAKFFSNINELEGIVEGGVVATPLGSVPAAGWSAGSRVKVLFRPESLHCAPLNGATGQVVLPATVAEARFIGVARLLRGQDNEVKTLPLGAGTLNVFKGKNTAHRVTPAKGARERIVAVFSYYERPGVMFSKEEQVGFYGRAA